MITNSIRLSGLSLAGALCIALLTIGCGQEEQSSGGIVTEKQLSDGMPASGVSFDNTDTTLTRTTVQAVLEEIVDLIDDLKNQIQALSGSSSSNCSTDTIKVMGTCMDVGIQVNVSTNEFTFENAADLCENAGKRLCTDAEIFSACRAGAIVDSNFITWEWTSAMSDGSKALQLMHTVTSNGTGCTESRAVLINTTNTANVRCCQN